LLTYGLLRAVRFMPSKRLAGERTPMPTGWGALIWLLLSLPWLLVAGLMELIVRLFGIAPSTVHVVGLAVYLYAPALSGWLAIRYILSLGRETYVLVWDEVMAAVIAIVIVVIWR
jgi:hypothetical protein